MLPLFVLASFPLFAAIGHDIYLNLQNPEKAFELTAAGFLWTKYHPESYNQAINTLPPEHWETINHLLTFKTVYIAAAISCIFYIIIILNHLLTGSKNQGKIQKTNYDKSAYAGFWIRSLAFFIDAFILIIPMFLLVKFMNPIIPEHVEDGSAEIIKYAPGYVAAIFALHWVYFIIPPCTPLQATPGKIILGLKIETIKGQRISFLRSIARHIGFYISAIPLYIGYIMAGFTLKKQTLHDKIAGTVVIYRKR